MKQSFRFPAGALASLAAALSLAFSLSSCVPQTDRSIVSMRAAGQTQPADNLPPSTEGGSLSSLAEQIEAPSRYQTEQSASTLKLTADAPLSLPDTADIPVRRASHSPYNSSELQQLTAFLQEELSLTSDCGPEDLLSDQTTQWESPHGVYLLHLSDGQFLTSRSCPMVWLSHSDLSTGSDGSFLPSDLSGFLRSEEERAALEKSLGARATALLQGITRSSDSFTLRGRQWLQVSSFSDGQTRPTGRYALRLTYVHSSGSIPLINHDWKGPTASTLLPRSQYIQITLQEDGTLIELKDIDREDINEPLERNAFLLPFSSIRQIFEQYMRAFSNTYPSRSGSPGSFVEINVSRAELAYQLIYDTPSPESSYFGSGYAETGELVPVWAFYGSCQLQPSEDAVSSSPQRRTQTEAEALLLTINAQNGTPYGAETASPLPAS